MKKPILFIHRVSLSRNSKVNLCLKHVTSCIVTTVGMYMYQPIFPLTGVQFFFPLLGGGEEVVHKKFFIVCPF